MRRRAEARPSRSGGELRQARIRCGVELRDVARELGVPSADLRAIEWERLDLLPSGRYAEKLIHRYEDWLAPDGVQRPVRVVRA
ncbi:MAG TPA: helix-turn-helix domain-containing protein [Gaiellaceae bacterium]|nr:helix-turn-helix domain-containing protein [Gaiellaceae bacterium]